LGDAAIEFGVYPADAAPDLEILRERGVPVESERGPRRRCAHCTWFGNRADQPARREALDLLIGLAIGESLYASLQMSHADPISARSWAVSRLVSSAGLRRCANASGLVGLLPAQCWHPLKRTRKQCGHALKEAFALNRVISMRYRDRHRNHTERLIEPHFPAAQSAGLVCAVLGSITQAIFAPFGATITDAFVTDTIFKPRPWDDFARMLEGYPTREA
jgi:hypothetical protein